MDFTRLTQGEKIAGVSGVALILIMFIFDWFGLEVSVRWLRSSERPRTPGMRTALSTSCLFITVVAAIGLALISASQTEVGLPVAASAMVAGLGNPLRDPDRLSASSDPPDIGAASTSGRGRQDPRRSASGSA